jgi:hypothetical protein
MPKHKPVVQDLTAAGIIKTCSVFVPVNAPLHHAIAAHRLAVSKPLLKAPQRTTARHALRAVILATTRDIPEAQRQFDYLSELPAEAWNGLPPQTRQSVLDGVTRLISTLRLN